MHRDIVLTPKFERAFRKFVARRPLLQQRIEETILKMQEDVFAAELGTHKLKGELLGLSACSCGYDFRIVFKIEPFEQREVIVLLDIGTHDTVY